MANSRDINYSTRPAKGAERKMLVEVASKLSVFHPLSEYQYVGYGGAYFCDFSLFHRALNICDMISIERDGCNQKRYEFNLPYNCIDLKFGEARMLLPGLPWKKPAIIWMDEIEEPSDELFETARAVLASLLPGSLIVLTFRELRLANQDGPRVEQMRRRFGRYFEDCDEAKLSGPALQRTVSKCFRTALIDRLQASDTGLPPDQQRQYMPLLNLSYGDDARMTTLGGLVLSSAQLQSVKYMELRRLEYVVKEDSPDIAYDLEIPNLSLKEVRALCEMLPHPRDAERLETLGLLPKDIDAFRKIYRHYMTLGEIITA